MMNEKDIVRVLKANETIADYEIIIKNKKSSELFYVLKKLELNRAIDTENISINVYVDVKDKRGKSTVLLTSADNEKSLNKKLNAAVLKGEKALNAYYPLASKQKEVNKPLKKDIDLNKVANKVGETIIKADTYEDGYINSTEVFVSKTSTLFINSRGVRQYSERTNIEFEIIPTWRNGNEEYELYEYYESNKLDVKEIAAVVDKWLLLARDRSIANKPSNLDKNIPILLQGEMNDLIVDTIKDNSSYMSTFMHTNHYNVGDDITSKFDLTLKANIDGCFKSSYFDNNGVALSSKKLIKDGKLVDNYGDIRFGHYLKHKKPSGNYNVAEITNYESYDYLSKPHIIIEHFSSPQMEDSSGYFGGEVRLARYFDGEKYVPLTSFTVSGNIYKSLKNVKFSKEVTTTRSYKGPKYFIFNDLDIS